MRAPRHGIACFLAAVIAFGTATVSSAANTPGSVDTSFGNNGSVPTPLNPPTPRKNAVAVQPDGKFLIAGWDPAHPGDPHDIVVRLRPNGAIDASFGTNGRVDLTAADPTGNEPSAITVDHAGRILLAYSNGSPVRHMAVVRLLPDGSFDLTFGSNGHARVLSVPEMNRVSDLIEQKVDNTYRIVIAGTAAGRHWQLVVAALTEAGTTDTTFGAAGTTTVPFREGSARGIDLVVQDLLIGPGNRVIVTGALGAFQDKPLNAWVVRLSTSGQRDDTFGVNGFSGVYVGPNKGLQSLDGYPYMGDGAVTDDGRILVTATLDTYDQPNTLVVLKFDLRGRLDSSFGTNGRAKATIPATMYVRDLQLGADGKPVLISGDRTNGGNVAIALTRLTPTGGLDTTFGTGGTTRGPAQVVRSTALQGSKLLLVGHHDIHRVLL